MGGSFLWEEAFCGRELAPDSCCLLVGGSLLPTVASKLAPSQSTGIRTASPRRLSTSALVPDWVSLPRCGKAQFCCCNSRVVFEKIEQAQRPFVVGVQWP